MSGAEGASTAVAERKLNAEGSHAESPKRKEAKMEEETFKMEVDESAPA